MPAIATMRAVVLDCPDPRALAEFYRALVGGDVTYADNDWVNLRDGGTVLLSFQRLRTTTRPTGPPWSTASSSTSTSPSTTSTRPSRRRPPLLPLLGLTPGLISLRRI